jgi:cephalosporin hydroxylase
MDFQSIYIEAAKNCSPSGTMVEIGVYIGESLLFLAQQAFAQKKNIRVVGVDAFMGVGAWGTPGSTQSERHRVSEKNNPQWYGVHGILAPVWKDVSIIKSLSVPAADFFRDASVDFVFIDADHNHDAALNDMRAWWPKVKSGGMMAGHDIGLDSVRSAVDLFSEEICHSWTVNGNSWIIG